MLRHRTGRLGHPANSATMRVRCSLTFRVGTVALVAFLAGASLAAVHGMRSTRASASPQRHPQLPGAALPAPISASIFGHADQLAGTTSRLRTRAGTTSRLRTREVFVTGF